MITEIILGFIIFILYLNFNGKISHLENEIKELKRRKLPNPEDNKLEEKSTIPKTDDDDSPNEIYINFRNLEDPANKEKKEKKEEKVENIWIDIVINFVKENILTIVGILTLVLGIGYFVKYAIDRNWINEPARFGIGIITGLSIITIGFFLRKNYSIFSAIISGGGIAVLYVSVTIAFQEYHLFSQNLAFILLTLITLLTVALSYLYDSEVLIIFSLLGGFGSPLMVSTGESNYLFLFTYISFLNIGMLIISYLKNWKSVGWIAYFISFVYLFFWVSDHTDIKAIYFILIFYIIFYLFSLRNYIKHKNWDKHDILLLVMTNISCVIAITYIFKDLNLEPIILFPLIFASINAILWFIEIRKKIEKIYNPVFVAITISLITIAVALQFDIHIFTGIWAIEATLLLFIWLKTKQNIFKKSVFYLLPLVIVAELISWNSYNNPIQLSFLTNKIFFTSVLINISFAINYYLANKSKQYDELNFVYNKFFKFLLYGNLYFTFLLEITHHIREYSNNFILVSVLLYSIYFVTILVLLSKYLLDKLEVEFFIMAIPALSLILVSVTHIIEDFISQNIYYGIYLIYIIPLIYTGSHIYKYGIKAFENTIYLIAFTVIYFVSIELSHAYILAKTSNTNNIHELKNHFISFFLPMIWTALAIVFLSIGLKNKIPDWIKAGFILIGLMVIKLYLLDVWNMDNISRIIAFIFLGIVLLLSSFMFQKLKDIFHELLEKKNP